MPIRLMREDREADPWEANDAELRFLKALNTAVPVKLDATCRGTDNVAIEFRQKGRPSGIATTEADDWAIEVRDDCWITLPTENLKAIARKYFKLGSVKRGGDDALEFVLIPVSEPLQFGT
jgi:hypothetical protein